MYGQSRIISNRNIVFGMPTLRSAGWTEGRSVKMRDETRNTPTQDLILLLYMLQAPIAEIF